MAGKKGRKPSGSRLVDRMDGPDRSKQRLKVILDTLSGSLSIDEACAELGIGPAAFHKLRSQTLQNALDGLAPRPMGRPPAHRSEEQGQVESLQEEVDRLRFELQASRLREEIALCMPHLLKKEKMKKKPNRKNRGRQGSPEGPPGRRGDT